MLSDLWSRLTGLVSMLWREVAKFGTVGAVALDAQGHLAAATSTGGMTNKRYGRVGDSPVIGAGTWADAECAVSGTGWGEFYIRNAVAHDICARVAYRGDSLADAGGQARAQVGDAAAERPRHRHELRPDGALGQGGVVGRHAPVRGAQPVHAAGVGGVSVCCPRCRCRVPARRCRPPPPRRHPRRSRRA